LRNAEDDKNIKNKITQVTTLRVKREFEEKNKIPR
jgi:hypothetical protein